MGMEPEVIKMQLWSNHEAEAEALTFRKHEAEAEALAFSKHKAKARVLPSYYLFHPQWLLAIYQASQREIPFLGHNILSHFCPILGHFM